MGRGLFPCVTAALSADVPSVDARPYRPTFKKSLEGKGSVTKNKIKAKTANRSITNKKAYEFNHESPFLQDRVEGAKSEDDDIILSFLLLQERTATSDLEMAASSNIPVDTSSRALSTFSRVLGLNK